MPNQYSPNLVFPVEDGFGLFVFFDKFEDTVTEPPNGLIQNPESRENQRKKQMQRGKMKKMVSCAFNTDIACMELKFADGSRISIDTVAVKAEITGNMYERPEPDYLACNDPAAHADLILNGDLEAYLKAATEYQPLDK